jgi:hypothetical protein
MIEVFAVATLYFQQLCGCIVVIVVVSPVVILAFGTGSTRRLDVYPISTPTLAVVLDVLLAAVEVLSHEVLATALRIEVKG